jgi:c-di-GMP-binding flagellar brake protein YcgR
MPVDSGSAGGASGPTGDGERREGPRIPIEMWVEETTASERYFRRAGNLSRGGLGLDHTIPLPIGTVVNLTFTLPGDANAVTIAGEIVSTAGPEELRMGVKFIDISDAARAQIDAYLARVGVSV